MLKEHQQGREYVQKMIDQMENAYLK